MFFRDSKTKAAGKIKFCQFPADFLIAGRFRARCDGVGGGARGEKDDEVRTNSREWATVCAHRNLRPARIDHQTDCNQTTLRSQRPRRLPLALAILYTFLWRNTRFVVTEVRASPLPAVTRFSTTRLDPPGMVAEQPAGGDETSETPREVAEGRTKKNAYRGEVFSIFRRSGLCVSSILRKGGNGRNIVPVCRLRVF